jgi:exosortase
MLNLKSGSARPIFFVLFVLALLASTWSTIRDLYTLVSDWDNNNASQALIVPFMSAALIYFRRKVIFERVRYDVLPGLLIMIAGAGLHVLGRTANLNWQRTDHLSLLTFSILVILWGGVVAFYGIPSFKAGLFPLLFLMFCVPIPSPIMDRITSVLQHGSADFAYVLLKLTGMPIYKDDVTFSLPGLDVIVAPECSGIRSGISLLILCLLAGNVVLRSWPRKLALVVAAIPILMFKNALRISTLSYLAVRIDHSILTSRLHQEGGIPFFVVGLLLLYPILQLLIKSEQQPSLPSRVSREVSL